MIKETYYLYGNTPMPNHFFIIGKDYKDCLKQLEKYGEQHPEKWVYFYDCGMHPGKPVPTAEQHFEVVIYSKKPAEFMIFYTLFQMGKSLEKEETTVEMRKKQLEALYILGTSFRK